MATRNPLISQPFALAGDKTTILVPAQAGGAVSFNQGWTPDYQADPASNPDAKPVDRGTMNFLFNILTANLQQYQREGVPEFIAAADNGGVPVAYPMGISVMWRALDTDPWRVYLNTVTNNVNAPPHASWLDVMITIPGSALRATPPQFDNGLLAASTAFVQRALGNYQDVVPTISTAVTLTASDVGKAVTIVAGGSIILPLGATVRGGCVLFISSTATGRVFSTQGSDIINTLPGSVSSITLDAGDTAELYWNGGQWLLSGGTAQLRYSAQFSALRANPGRQRLPGGYLQQWGQTVIGAGANVVITLPIAYTSNILNAQATFVNTSADIAMGSAPVAQVRAVSATQLTLRNLDTVSREYFWQTIGV